MRSGAMGETLFPNIERRYAPRQDRRAHQTQHALLMCAPPRPALAPHQPQARSPAPRLAPPSPEPAPKSPPGRRASGPASCAGSHSSRPRAARGLPLPRPLGMWAVSAAPATVSAHKHRVWWRLRCVGLQWLRRWVRGVSAAAVPRAGGTTATGSASQAALSAGRGRARACCRAMCTLPRLQPVQSQHCPGCGPSPPSAPAPGRRRRPRRPQAPGELSAQHPAVTPAPGVSSTPEASAPSNPGPRSADGQVGVGVEEVQRLRVDREPDPVPGPDRHRGGVTATPLAAAAARIPPSATRSLLTPTNLIVNTSTQKRSHLHGPVGRPL